ncbi:MAG TPA: dihydrolipoyllysine-residue acetyltransferase [Gammaproteobacteria bacterium]|nr:dihydrolipoyllysine-residue acetyltransferase [Gammaproteobacteria bacterium]
MAETKEVKVPDIGDFEKVDVIDVMVGEGDSIDKETPLITLETDKAAMDVPSPFAGKIKSLKISTGDKVSQGDVIATVEVEAAEAKGEGAEPEAEEAPAKEEKAEPKQDQAKQKPEEKKQEPKPAAPPQKREERHPAPGELPPIDEASFGQAHASPSVRKFARELGADLSRVEGSGRKNRITHDDVKAFVKRIMQGGSGAGGGLPAVPAVDFAKFGEIERKPLSRIKKISGPRVHASWVNLPHVTQHDDADITAMESVRQALKPEAEAHGAKLTPLAFLIKACVAALKEYPDFNSSLDTDGETLIYKKYFHVGFAVDTEGGLVVPVIRDADQKNLLEIAAELGELSDKARKGKLTANDMQGGCFSISSLGSIGGTYFTPIINAPEVAILGVSRSSVKPVFQNGQFVPRTILPLSLSYDHRVIDGASAARFTRFLAETLESMKGLIF